MNSAQFKEIVKNAFLFIAGFIDLTLLLRLILKLIAASTESSFVSAVYGLTEPFFKPFEGTLGNPAAGPVTFEIDTLIAMITYSLLGFFFFKLFQAIFEDSVQERLHDLLDLFFKLAETVLVYRLVFKMLGAAGSMFLDMLYVVSSPFYAPFQGLLPSLEYENFVFETSTFVAIILLIVMDVVTENLFTEVKKRSKKVVKKEKPIVQYDKPISEQTISRPQPETFHQVQSGVTETPAPRPQEAEMSGTDELGDEVEG